MSPPHNGSKWQPRNTSKGVVNRIWRCPTATNSTTPKNRKSLQPSCTGPTGSGKTTFLSQLSLDFALQGVNTLWGSFEIKNTRLLQHMLVQYAGITGRRDLLLRHHANQDAAVQAHIATDGARQREELARRSQLEPGAGGGAAPATAGTLLPGHGGGAAGGGAAAGLAGVPLQLKRQAASSGELSLESFGAFASEFSDLPLHFLRFYGSTEVEKVLDAMEYAAYAHDVEHVVLDNLQFMMGQEHLSVDK